MSSNVINMTTSIIKVTNQIRINDKTVMSNQEYVHLCQYESGIVRVLSTLFGIKLHCVRKIQDLTPLLSSKIRIKKKCSQLLLAIEINAVNLLQE